MRKYISSVAINNSILILNPAGLGDFRKAVDNIVGYAQLAVGMVLVVRWLYIGYKIITSSAEERSHAYADMRSTIIGTMIVIFAETILEIVKSALGFF